MNLKKFKDPRANTFVGILIFLAIMSVAAYIVYNNPDFQKKYRKEISKTRYYMKDNSKAVKKFLDESKVKLEDLQKADALKSVKFTNPFAKQEKPKVPTYEDMSFDTAILSQEVPLELVRHQADEMIICSFDANFLLNSPLTDKEIQHLANIIRFCDLSAISGLSNTKFIERVSEILKILRYNVVVDVSPPDTADKTISAFLYRDDRITAIKPAKILQESEGLPHAPFYGIFRAMDFDFTVAIFQTPAMGYPLPSLSPLERMYELIKLENPDVKDLIVFGDFGFRSAGLNWDNNSLLPVMARLKKDANGQTKDQTDLLGNLWFRKKDLVEFSGNAGEINIKEEHFPSTVKPIANKPIWAQFKAMPDDD